MVGLLNRGKYFFIQHAIEQWNSLQQDVLDDNSQLTKNIQIVKVQKHSDADEAPSHGFARLLAMGGHITG